MICTEIIFMNKLQQIVHNKVIIPQKEQNTPFVGIERGIQKQSTLPIPLGIIRERSRGSNLSINSLVEEEMITPKNRNN